jgi:hypothetical protein
MTRICEHCGNGVAAIAIKVCGTRMVEHNTTDLPVRRLEQRLTAEYPQ